MDGFPLAVETPIRKHHAEAVTEAQAPKAGALASASASAVAADQCVISIVQAQSPHVQGTML